MKSPLPALPHRHTAQSLVEAIWNVVTRALEHVANVEWVECTCDPKLSVAACWFVLTRAERPAVCHAHHVPNVVKTVAYTVNAEGSVASCACHVVSFVRGIAAIIAVTRDATRFVTDRDVTNPATKFCLATMSAEASCVKENASAPCVQKMMVAIQLLSFSWVLKMRRMRGSLSFQIVDISS